MRPETQEPIEHRVSLTRVCLRGGSVVLPLAARASFEGRDVIEAVDLDRGETHILELGAKNRLIGLGDFFEAQGMTVNDVLVLRPLPDGRVALRARGRPRSVRRDSEAVRRAVDGLLAGGPPRTLEELRFDHGLADDAPLRAALERDSRLTRRAGRWTVRDEAAATPQAVPPTSPRTEPGTAPETAPGTSTDGSSDPSSGTPLGSAPRGAADEKPRTTVHVTRRAEPRRGVHDAGLNSASDLPSTRAVDRARAAFRGLGYQVATGRDGALRLSTRGRRHQQVLVRVLGEGESPDWNALLYTLRETRADRLALVGDARDLHPLERPARGARATLWSWDGLDRLAALRSKVPIGPIDLASAFEEGGMHDAGLDRFEAIIGQRLEAHGAFSEVLVRLADLPAPTVFTVAELGLDDVLSREGVLRVLDALAGPPFGWTAHLGPGEYALRYAVGDGLNQLQAYAASMHERLPDRRRTVIRGNDVPVDGGTDAPELLGQEELAFVGAGGVPGEGEGEGG